MMGNPHVERTYGKRLKRMCAQKIRHPARSSAEAHAERLNRWKVDQAAIKAWQPYLCPVCEQWHVGRPPDEGRRGFEPIVYDATMIDAIGERAYYCGLMESEGPPRMRLKALQQRARAAIKRAYFAKMGYTPEHTGGHGENQPSRRTEGSWRRDG